MCRNRSGYFSTKQQLLGLLALILPMMTHELDARFLETHKRPPGTVGIVPNDEDGERVHFGQVASVSTEAGGEKASEMISVKLLNQFHTRPLMPIDEQGEPEVSPANERSSLTGSDYKIVNLAHHNVVATDEPHLNPPPPIETVHIDVKENIIEDDFLPTDPMMVDKLLRDDGPSPETPSTNEVAARAGSTVGVVSPIGNRSVSATLTTTTTRTTTSTTTVRKVRRKSIVMSGKPTMTGTTTQRTRPAAPTATLAPRLTTAATGRKPPVPRIDITKLNLEHLENELIVFPHLGPSQGSLSGSARVRPRRIRAHNLAHAPAEPSTCGCQHRKRSLAPSQFPSEESSADFGDDYDDDYDDAFNDLRGRSVAPYGRPMLFPVVSRLLAPGSSETAEGSVERAEMVHGTLERLMGIVSIVSHVDEFIQRKTKQSIRRLARLYESEEMYY